MKILGIGIATLDIINTVDGYPAENSEVRAIKQRQCRGGNVTNTLAVLSQLGHQCSWGGVLADEPDTKYIVDDLEYHKINYQNCRHISDGKTPASYITLNQHNGSRTIIHYRDLPEFGFRDFNTINLASFDWVHFEGRNVVETGKMLYKCATEHPSIPRSLEVEKVRPGIENIFKLADILLFSKSCANQLGFTTATGFLHSFHKQLPHTTLICAWGSEGASAITTNGTIHTSRAFPPTQIVDTNGAGDVFNAGIIDYLLRHEEINSALSSACQLAGYKCGISGIDVLQKR